MSVWRLHWTERPPIAGRGAVVSVGNFDGVHRGHGALLAHTQAIARTLGVPTVALTFDPPPRALLVAEAFGPPLTTLVERAELLMANGIDHVAIVRTTPELLQLSAEQFFTQILLEGWQIRGLVEGENFRFGRDRSGGVAELRSWCAAANVAFRVAEPLTDTHGWISSSRIRMALNLGDVELAATLLGRPFRSAGVVGTGAKRGRTLGFPTANLEQVATLLPAEGVYAGRAWVGQQAWPAAINLGPNPTFAEPQRKLEIHLIGFTGDLYGQPLVLEWLTRLRATRPFAGITELVAQLRADVAAAAVVVASR